MSVQKRRRQAINRRQWVTEMDVRWSYYADRIPRSAIAVSKCGCGRTSWLLEGADDDERRAFDEDNDAHYCEAAS